MAKTKMARLEPAEMALIKALRVCGMEPSEVVNRIKDNPLIAVFQATLKQELGLPVTTKEEN